MPNGRRRRTLAVATALTLMLLTIGIRFPTDAAASSPRLRLRPNDGLSGSIVSARGRHFTPGAAGSVIWAADGSVLVQFTTGDDGTFDVTPAPTADTPTAPPTAGSPATTPVSALASPAAIAANDDCTAQSAHRRDVHNAAELAAALAAAQPGDLILLADGVCPGTFTIANSGTADARIALCGSRDAVIDGGDVGNGYALHITADYWTISGFTVTNALKGIMIDDGDFDLLDRFSVHTIGHEGVHFRTNSSDNVIQDSDVYDTGRKKAKFGEGVYVGSAVSNWGKYTGGHEDRSDRNAVLRNRIWNTIAECIDVKEDTTGGLIEGNVMDGSQLTGADSWLDLKGNAYLVRANTGTNSPGDGYQTHVINDLPWGCDNVFAQNVVEVNGKGSGF
jgi:hypothetical protein